MKDRSKPHASTYRYDVFISYSHAASGELAPAIQRGLERLARPWHKRWALRVFRDTSGLGVNEALWPRIADAIRSSRQFILLASPGIAGSRWVQREVAERIQSGGSILIGLTEGEILWDPQRRDFDWSGTDALPQSLAGHFRSEPLYLDLRWADDPEKRTLSDPAFRDAIAAFGAAIRGIDKDELHSEAARVQRRAMQVAWSAAATLVVLLGLSVVLGVAAWQSRNEALRALARSEARRLAIEASSAPAQEPQRKLLLAIQSVREAEHAGIGATQAGLQAVRDNMVGGQPLVGHTAGVSGIEISKDGQRLVSISSDKTARIWSLESGESVVLRGHEARINAAAFSRDGQRVITGSNDGTGRVWNTDGSGTPVVLHTSGTRVQAVAFSHDGQLAITVTDEAEPSSLHAEVQVWRSDGTANPRTLARVIGGPDSFVEFDPGGLNVLLRGSEPYSAQIRSLDGTGTPFVMSHALGVRYATISRSGVYAATTSVDGTARVWPLLRGTGREFYGHQQTVIHAQFDRESDNLITASFDGTARIWSLDGTVEPIEFWGHDDFLYEAWFSEDGSRIVTASGDQTARVWRRDGLGRPLLLRGHEDRVWWARFTPDGNRIVTASTDNAPRVWNAWAVGEPRMLWGHADAVWEAAVSPDGTHVLTVSSDGLAILWDLESTEFPTVLRGHTDRVMDGDFSPDGRLLVTGSTDGTARLWRAGDGEHVRVLGVHSGQVGHVSFNARGTHVVSTSWDDGFARLFTLGTQTETALRPPIDARIYDVGFNPDGLSLATAWTDGVVRIWNLDGELVRELDTGASETATEPGSSTRTYLTYSADGSRLVTNADDMYEGGTNLVQIWPANGDGKPVSLDLGDTLVSDARFSPDGTMVATAIEDAILIWPVDGGNPRTLRGHEDIVLEAAFSPDSQWLATASRDQTARVWSLNTDEPPTVLRGHSGDIRSIRFTPDGQSIVTGSHDGTGRVWTLSPDVLIARACAAVGRNLSEAEWRQYLGTRSREKTCPQWLLEASEAQRP